MKELSIEEKAKRYDEAIKFAYNKHRFSSNLSEIKLIEELFPELKEDEREIPISEQKSAEEYNITGIGSKNAQGKLGEMIKRKLEIEKQCEQKLYVNDNAKEMFIKALERVEEQNNKGYKLTDCDKNSWWEDFKVYTTSWQNLANSEKTCKDEQKPAEKVEPKFKVGDWVVYCNEDVDLITGIKENGYCINNGGYIPFICASDIRLWTIQDAKDGDVLAEDSCIFIIQKLGDNSTAAKTYCTLYDDGNFDDGTILYFDIDSTKPATKEQRDLMFQKIKEAGYEWDAEKLELKKIEQESTWNEEDEKLFRCAIDAVKQESKVRTDGCLDEEVGEMVTNWLKSLKGRVQPQPKQEWSVEDKDTIKFLINHFCVSHYNRSFQFTSNKLITYDELLEKIRNLRPQNTWKPSDEQMKALEKECMAHSDYELCRLLEQLKKLTE